MYVVLVSVVREKDLRSPKGPKWHIPAGSGCFRLLSGSDVSKQPNFGHFRRKIRLFPGSSEASSVRELVHEHVREQVNFVNIRFMFSSLNLVNIHFVSANSMFMNIQFMFMFTSQNK